MTERNSPPGLRPGRAVSEAAQTGLSAPPSVYRSKPSWSSPGVRNKQRGNRRKAPPALSPFAQKGFQRRVEAWLLRALRGRGGVANSYMLKRYGWVGARLRWDVVHRAMVSLEKRGQVGRVRLLFLSRDGTTTVLPHAAFDLRTLPYGLLREFWFRHSRSQSVWVLRTLRWPRCTPAWMAKPPKEFHWVRVLWQEPGRRPASPRNRANVITTYSKHTASIPACRETQTATESLHVSPAPSEKEAIPLRERWSYPGFTEEEKAVSWRAWLAHQKEVEEMLRRPGPEGCHLPALDERNTSDGSSSIPV